MISSSKTTQSFRTKRKKVYERAWKVIIYILVKFIWAWLVNP